MKREDGQKIEYLTFQDWCWFDSSRCPDVRGLYVFGSHCRSNASQLFHHRVHIQENLLLAHLNMVAIYSGDPNHKLLIAAGNIRLPDCFSCRIQSLAII